MTILIPTSELLGLLTDVMAFAPADKDDPYHGVMLQWAHVGEPAEIEVGMGVELSASAYGTFQGARATWQPGAGRENEVDETDKAPAIDVSELRWGGTDAPWRAFLDMSDVRDLVKLFKVPAKLWAYPLTLKMSPTGQALTVSRTAEYGKPEAMMTLATATGDVPGGTAFPDIAAVVALARDNTVAAEGETFWPHALGMLGSVRQHAALYMTMPGPSVPALLSMGERWQGFVYSVRDGKAAGARRAELGL